MGKVKVNNRAHVECIRATRALLSEKAWNLMLKEYKLIAYLAKLASFPIQSPTMQWLIYRGEVDDSLGPNKRTLKFNISGHSYTFGHVEFALVTGLEFGEYFACDEEAETPFRLFLGNKTLRFSELEAKLTEEAVKNNDSIEIRKLAAIYMLHSLVFVKDAGNLVHPRAISLVDDPVLFNSYPWGRLVYDELVKEWGHFFQRVSKPGLAHLKLGTFPFAIQAWVLECLLPDAAATLAVRLPGNPIPRVYRWDTSHPCGYSMARQNIYEFENLAFLRVAPEPAELETDYYEKVRKFVDYKPPAVASVATDDDENTPLGMTVAMKKLEKKSTGTIKKLEDRIIFLEGRVESLEKEKIDAKMLLERIAVLEKERLDAKKLEERIASLEKEKMDAKKIEIKVMKAVKQLFQYEFATATTNMENQIRAELNLNPILGQPAVEVVYVSSQEGAAKEAVTEEADTGRSQEGAAKETVTEEADTGRSQEGAAKEVVNEETGSVAALEAVNAVVDAIVQTAKQTVGVEEKAIGTKLLERFPKKKRPAAAKVSPSTEEKAKKPRTRAVVKEEVVKKEAHTGKKVHKKVVKEDKPKRKLIADKETNQEPDLPIAMPIPHPYHATKVFAQTIKCDMIRTWVSKNKSRANVAGLVTAVKSLDTISCKILGSMISERGWLSSEEIDAHLQLLNMQVQEYPTLFNSTRWTCMGTIYNRNVKYGLNMFNEHRKQLNPGDGFSWSAVDTDMCMFVAGVHSNWENLPWIYVDQIYGIDNIASSHWAAYEYNFEGKEVRVYDSLLSSYDEERRELFAMHAALAPSLYNESRNHEHEKIDPYTPFTVKYVEVPQQPNSWDCGVYAIKFIQCLAMNCDIHGLEASDFKEHRMKLAVDLVKWSKLKSGKYLYEERNILV